MTRSRMDGWSSQDPVDLLLVSVLERQQWKVFGRRTKIRHGEGGLDETFKADQSDSSSTSDWYECCPVLITLQYPWEAGSSFLFLSQQNPTSLSSKDADWSTHHATSLKMIWSEAFVFQFQDQKAKWTHVVLLLLLAFLANMS